MPRKQSSRSDKAKVQTAKSARARRASPKDSAATPRTRSAETADPGLDLFISGQREVLSLVAGHADLNLVLSALDRLFRDLLGAARGSYVVIESQEGADCLMLTPQAKSVGRLDAERCRPLVERVARTVKTWDEPLAIDAAKRGPELSKFRALLGQGSGRMGWALPIRGQDEDALGFVLLRFDGPPAPDATARRYLGLLEPLTRVAVDSARRDKAAKVADERFASLAATIPGVVYQRLVTPDGDIRYSYISEGARDLFGVEPEDILNDPQALFGRHGPKYRTDFRDRLLAASKALTLWDVEAQIVTPDGQEKWTHAIARPHRRDDGSVMWNGVILDATRIKEAEFAAAAAEERSRAAIVESISQGIAIFDPDDRLITWNSKLLNLFPGLDGAIETGVGYRTILQAEADGCVEPDGSAPGKQMLRDRLRRHDDLESSVERRLADGRWILINERRGDAGTIVLYTDVTDLKRREEQLHLAKTRAELANAEMEKTVRRLDIALGNMTQGLCLFDSQLHSILCNRRYAKIFRLPPELTGPGVALHDQISHVAGHGKAGEAETIALVDDRLSLAASRARGTYRLTLPDRRVIEVIHQPLPDGGAVETFTEVAADAPQALLAGAVQDRDEAATPDGGPVAPAESAAALAQARDEARSADRGKAEFLRAFGQALKASLETIVDTSEAMTGAVYGPLGDQRYQQFAQSIRDSGTALMSLIDDIEEISTLSAGDLELSERPLDLGELLARCVRVARHSADGTPPTISIVAPSDGYEIKADETKLRQAFLNILSNAVRFTPAKGRIEVSIGNAEDGGLDVTIADTGAGMPPRIISSLMTPLRAGEAARQPEPNGAHLGLPVVKSLIERHGGNLVLASAKGKGTTAVVHLPDSRVLARPTT